MVVLLGLNEALTPFERPEADRLTLPLNPFSGLTVMVLVPLPPRRMLRLLGDAERLKLGCGAGLTVRVIDVVCVKLPLVPVIINEYVPPAVVLVVFTVSVDVPEPVTVLGLKPGVAPVGSPLTLSPTTPLNPFSDPTVTV